MKTIIPRVFYIAFVDEEQNWKAIERKSRKSQRVSFLLFTIYQQEVP